jgi:hypothetical protein
MQILPKYSFLYKGLFLLLTIIVLFTACKKDGKDTTNVNRLPLSIVHTETYGSATLNLTYNSDSTLQSITSTGYDFSPDLTLSYLPFMMLVKGNWRSYPDRSSLDSITLNPSGRITNVRMYSGANRTAWNNDRYTLNTSNEIIQMERSVSSSQKTTKFPFTYANGNLIRGSSAGVFLYDTSKRAQLGDYHSIMNLLSYGVKYNFSKDLVVAAVYGSDTTFYNYTFDKFTRITQLDEVQNGKHFTQFTYSY